MTEAESTDVEWFTTSEVAARLECCTKTVLRSAKRKRVPLDRPRLRGEYRFNDDDVARMLEIKPESP